MPGNQPIYPTGYINIPSAAGTNNPGYAHNTRTLFTTVLTCKWNDKLTQVLETDQGWELHVPGLVNNGATTAGRTAEWFSFGNWFLYQFTPKITGVWRSEVFFDPTGARTGYADTYQEITMGAITNQSTLSGYALNVAMTGLSSARLIATEPAPVSSRSESTSFSCSDRPVHQRREA